MRNMYADRRMSGPRRVRQRRLGERRTHIDMRIEGTSRDWRQGERRIGDRRVRERRAD
jgi:hypothetical protein